MQQPKSQQVPHHLAGVTNGLDPGGLDVTPGHGDLVELESPAPGENQKLDVKGETLGVLDAGERVPEVAREQLETALRVMNAPQKQGLDHEVEGASHEIAVTRLGGRDQPTVEGTRTDPNGATIAGSAQHLQLIDGRGQIGVAEQELLASGARESRANRRPLSPILLMGNHLELHAISKVHIASRGSSPVARAVVHHDHFARQPVLRCGGH